MTAQPAPPAYGTATDGPGDAGPLGMPLRDVLKVVRRYAAGTDLTAAFPVRALTALRDSRLLGLLVPERDGGPGGTLADMLKVSMELSRECASVGMIYAMHCQQVATVVRFATGRVRTRLLPRIARGELYLASVTTEPGKGGDLLVSEAALEEQDGTLRIDREAPIVTGGTHADGFLITMRAPAATSPSQVSLVFADRDQLDIIVTGDWRSLGMRATHSVPMHLKGEIPAWQAIGQHGNFRRIAVVTLAPYAHLGWSACWLGAAQGALARTVAMLRSDRGRAGKDLGSQLLLTRLSSARARLDSVHAMLWHTARVYDTCEDVSVPSVQLLLNALKITASQQCLAAVDELIELAGLRHGYLASSPLFLERTFRDLRSATLNYGNDRLHLVDGSLVLMDPEVHLA